jgi:hypothetical protein
MSPRSTDYALLSQNTYHDTPVNDKVELDGITYRVMDSANDPKTGFQAQAYVREDVQPHQVIIAYRGTEFDREPVHDGGVDAGMVLAGVNLQTADSTKFTEKVMAEARQAAKDEGRQPPDITVTGHSLGGTLAEINASRYGLKGETFNAYGAAGLLEGVPKGGNQVIDHVRAGDVVSAASEHFGEVRIYAAQKDIDTLSHAGYRDDSGLLSLRNPVKAIDFDSHAIDNFVPNSKLLGQSIISPESQARYVAHEGMVDRYRNDVMDIRKGLSAPWEIPKTIAEEAIAVGHAVADKVGEAAHAVEQTVEHVAHEVKETYDHVKEEISEGLHAIGEKASHAWDTVSHPSSWFKHDAPPRIDSPDHPQNAMFQQARDGVYKLDAQHGRTPNTQSDQFAGSLTASAVTQGLTRIDQVALNDDASRAYAIQGAPNSPFKQVAEVNTQQALATPLEKSSETIQQQAAQQAQVQQGQPLAEQQSQQRQGPSPSGP